MIVLFSVIMRNIFILIVVLCACCAAQDQQPQRPTLQPRTPGPQASDDEEIQAQLAKTAMATIQWDKSSTPGMKAEVQLIKKEQVNGKQVVQYRFKISGAPHNQLYSLISWPVTFSSPVTIMDGLAIAADGTVGCPQGSTMSCAKSFKGVELQLTYAPSIGEIYRHALMSDDKKSRIFFSFVPFPIVETERPISHAAWKLSS